ncbi:RNA polymerase sigma factor [Subsaximicrobium wynnwilliamsii]|uniref:RNA polymerase sigma factor n=1 Tax=Subsaximicrobium wynnwilliamsii TaxID=291179 RepID=A0A5C6ZKX3_9FLAO|nr:RNA polymerase sigma factor [Subsaximicrobium wynnwilliamsii]TXD84583.1 RNA polymerase sigma factor [Subsaximicrobium wynnwilliamsii]TXD90265.1 RNA polymerase sigma factor [Subsaximicrobium wynnwilliamsii]TXE04316.1 RNA polymerase sigma factor [Subsaximicrobium wynnwilliamsii]
MSTPIEKNIVSLLEQGDERALDLLYEYYGDSLYGVILQVTSNEELAQDALQETFIKVWKNGKKYDSSKAKLFTWLYRIAKNTAIDKLRSFKNRFEKEVQIDKSDVYILPTASLNQDVMDLKEHVARLEDKYQIVLKALFFEGMTQQEASEELDIPLGTIKSRLKIGLRELKKVYVPKI